MGGSLPSVAIFQDSVFLGWGVFREVIILGWQYIEGYFPGAIFRVEVFRVEIFLYLFQSLDQIYLLKAKKRVNFSISISGKLYPNLQINLIFR